MNKEFLTENKSAINSSNSDTHLGQTKLAMARNKAIEKGNMSEELTNHPGWKQLIGDLEGEREKALVKLRACATIKEMQGLQAELKYIDFILSNPKSYQNVRDQIINRSKPQWTKPQPK